MVDVRNFQWPANVEGKVIGWGTDGKFLENKDVATPADLDLKQDQSDSLDTLAEITPGAFGQARLADPDAATAIAALNTKALNADAGFTLAATQATVDFNQGHFGGLFLSGASSNVLSSTASATHTGPRFTAAITRDATGSGTNGPGSQSSALWLFSGKTDWLTSSVQGEVDGMHILVQQGATGDLGGMLIGAYKVDGGTGGIVCIESVANRTDATGTAILSNDSVVNFLEGVGALSNGGGHGFYSEAREGTIFSAFTAAAGQDFSADLTYYFTGSLSRDTTDITYQVASSIATGTRMFNLHTDNSNYEAGVLRWTSNVFQMGTDSPGTGTVREFALVRDGVSYLASIGAGINLPNNIALHSAGTIFMDGNGRLRIKGYTAAELGNAAHAVNTTNKAFGVTVIDTTNSKVFYAGGALTTSQWVAVDAATANITPV